MKAEDDSRGAVRAVGWFGVVVLVACLAGCRQDMHDQPRYEPFEASGFFTDGRSVRPQVEGTVARGQLRGDEQFFTGMIGDELAPAFPFPITRANLERGRERFEIFCAPCHGSLGDGRGMVVQRGFRRPPSYHIDRLREAPPGHYFDVITRGFGAMADFSDRISPQDRWNVAAYIRALQLSRQVELEGLPESVRREFQDAVQP